MNRKISIFLIVFSVFISIGAVSAENVTDDSAIDILSTADDASFTALNATINSGNTVIEITKDYTFNNKSDMNFVKGILINNRDIVVNGNNHTIDAKGQARIFKIENTSSMVISNLILKNTDDCAIVNYGSLNTSHVEFNTCFSDEGGAVYMEESKYFSDNDRFINNFAKTGAAINAIESVIKISNAYFENNKGMNGVIYSSKNNLTVNNATFKNNKGIDGTVIKSFLSRILVNNSLFKGNIVDNDGLIFSDNDYLTIDNSLFEGNSANRGSAVAAANGNVTLSNSLFKNNLNNWSSIYLISSSIDILNATFSDSTSRYATAIYNTDGETIIRKSRFINLSANITGGALAFRDSNDVTIESCEFINVSSAKNGGVIYTDILAMAGLGEGMTVIKNTLFENCSSGFGGACLQLGGKLSVDNSRFINNFAQYNGGAIYISNSNITVNNSVFSENSVVVTYDDYATYGGAIFSDNTFFNVYNSRFISNSAVVGSAFFMYDTTYDLHNLEFDGNGNAVYGLFDEGSKSDFSGTDNISADDFGNEEYYDVVSGAGMQIVLQNNTSNVTSIPARYDLREENLVTPVKNQGAIGACWAFGQTAALESALLKVMNYTADFSENNMQNSMLCYSKFGVTNMCEGADNVNGIAYLVSWFGAFPKDYDSYDELGKISPLIRTDEDVHVQDVIIIPHTPGNNESITNVKKAILKYGALSGTILSKSSQNENDSAIYYNENTSAEYCPNHTKSNHAIAVVGWDDNYPASNFSITPPGDGAWIVKNSWGTEWGDKGYFYVSYYDQTMCAFPDNKVECFVAVVFENTLLYDNNYQYDFSGLSTFFKNNDTKITYFNNYEAEGNELIGAVGTYFESEGVEYEVQIDVNDEVVYKQTGVSPFYGYHTIKLDKNVSVKKGDNFTVAITANAVPLCNKSRTHYKERSSIVLYQDGDSQDISALGIVACLKAYTFDDKRNETILITPQRVISVNDGVNGYDYQFILKDANGTALAGKEVTVLFFGKKQTVTTDENGWGTVTVKANEEAIYDIEVTFEGDDDYIAISQTSTIKLVREKTAFIAPNRTVYVRDMSRGYTYSAILKDANGKAIANRKVLFTFDGKKQVTYTDENGYATVKLTAVNAGTQTVTIRFAGDRYYHQTETTRIIKIVRESTKLTVADKTFVSSDVPKKVTATLKSKSDNPVYGAKVTLTVGGKTYSATTDNNGVAVFKIDLTKLGIFTATTKFADSRFYAATGTTSKIYII